MRGRSNRGGDATRVLFINTAKLPPLGAGPWLHAQVLRCIDRSTHELHLACAAGPGQDPSPMGLAVRAIPDVHVRLVDFGPERFGQAIRGTWRERQTVLRETARAVRSAVSLAWFVRRRRIDVIHTDERPRDAMVAVAVAKLTGARSIVHMHVDYGDWMSPLLKWALKRADAIMAVSDFVARTIIDSGHRADRTRVVLNAIEPTAWSPGVGRADIRRELGISDGAPVLIIVCRLIQDKGVDVMLRVLPEVRRAHPDVRLLVVGQQQFAGYLDELQALAGEMGVLDAVTFTGRREDVARLMAAADVFAMPSVREPFGLVYLEAMAMRLPVVGVTSGGVPEFVEQGVTGVLTGIDDVAALSREIVTLLDDPAKRRAMGEAGRRAVEESYSSERMARDCADVYRWLLDRPS